MPETRSGLRNGAISSRAKKFVTFDVGSEVSQGSVTIESGSVLAES